MTKKSKIIKNSDSKPTRPTNDYYAAATYSPSASETSTKEQLIININSNNKKRKLSNSSANDDLDDYFELRNWNLNEKVNDLNSYNKSNFVQYLDAKEFTYSKVQQNGFQTPVVFKDKSGLDMRTPSKIFTVNDIKTCVGSKRVIDVIDCSTQKNLQMTMKEWCEYYENTNRDRILNVISLEFSHTKLEDYVEPPLIVRQLDWIETAWPKQLRLAQTDATNSLEKMKYPKVQKYVLMSVAECFTDFHIDMGGTSVWYHVLKGEKIFWLIPPTDKNLEIYQKWILTGNQSEQFLPDLVNDCQRIVLQQGWTFMLPSGWIHGVYTSKDSIVFGGNFLHSFNIEMQLKIYKIETKTKVPDTYRYPFYLKMIWFLIERYVHCFTGITHLDSSCHLDSATFSNIKQQIAYKTFEPELLKNNLTQFELNGLIKLKEFLSNIKNNVNTAPNEIIDANLLFSKFIDIIDKQQENTLDSVITVKNEPFIHWPKMEKKYLKKIQSAFNSSFSSNDTNSSNNIRKHIMRNIPRTKGSIKKRLRPQNLPRSNVERRRRVRCHRCEPCTRDDCGECKYCKDMKKFGGTGISKQCCLSKQCLQPLLPTTTTCMSCEAIIDRKHENEKNIMYECEICFEIYHIQCFKEKYSYLNSTESVINEDLNNCWKCANCLNKGYNKQTEQQTIKQEYSQVDLSLQQALTLNTSSNLSDSLNNSFNSSTRTNDMFVSPISTDLNVSIEMMPVKKKRHRRTKLEILNSKTTTSAQTETINMNKKKKYSSVKLLKENKKVKIKKSIISIDSLTSYEKQIILDEFCIEIYQDDYESSKLIIDQTKQEKKEELEPGEIISNIDYEDNSSVDNNYSLSTQNSFAINSDEEEDDDEFIEKEEHINKENNLNTKTNESLLKMIQTN